MTGIWQSVITDTRLWGEDNEWKIQTVEHTEINTGMQFKDYKLFHGDKYRGTFETMADARTCYFAIEEVYQEIKERIMKGA